MKEYSLAEVFCRSALGWDDDWNVNGELSSFRNMAQYGLMPAFHYKYAIAKCLSIYEEKRECKNY